jgi:hypothetical protein
VYFAKPNLRGGTGISRFRASLIAMRRISWIGQRIGDAVALLWLLPVIDVSVFGCDGLVSAKSDRRHHGEGEYGHGNAPVPAMPGSALV